MSTKLTLCAACEFARRHDSRIGVTVNENGPLFYFFDRVGELVMTEDARDIVRKLRDHDLQAVH